MTLSVEDFARPISDAARIVRAMIPRHSLDLEDLVQVGWEKTLRYLAGQESVSPTLVFVAAKLAMLNAHEQWMQKAWIRNASGNRVRRGEAPALTEWQEWQRAHPTPPIEALIDVYRALLRARDEDRSAWQARWAGYTVREAGEAQQCRAQTIVARSERVDSRLRRLAA